MDCTSAQKILIVDDEKDMLEIINDILSVEDYQLINAGTGEEALIVLEREKIDLMLLDLNMPGIGGYEVCRRIKRIPGGNRSPMIIVSANSQEVDKIAALGLGAVDYITKPFPPGELRARVKSQLKLKGMHDDLLQQKQAMSRLAVHDELTGLFNRRYLLSRMDDELARAERYRSTVACMIIDIDGFKKINDTHGHNIGDEVLKDLSNLLKDFVRETDVVARFGGEEFIILLPETDTQGASAFAERLLDNIRNFVFAKDSVSLRVTGSIGISSNQAVNVDKHRLLKEADECLYKAKNEGKNRVCS